MPPPTTAPLDAGRPGTYEPGLDGLRALAVAAVVAYHAGGADGVRWLEDHAVGGFLGVSAFFTLSGFLITTLLLREHTEHGSISLRRFYSRRIRRLLPASLLTLLAVLALTPTLGTDGQLTSLGGEAVAALANVANWHTILRGNDYAATFASAPSPLRHMWSLSVEEQWYMVVPLLTMIVLRLAPPRRRRLALGTLMAVLTAGSITALWVVGHGRYANRIYLGTDTRVAELAIGGLAAVLLARHHHLARRSARTGLGIGGAVLLGIGLGVWSTTDIHDGWLYRWGLPVHAVGTALVVWSALQPDTPLRSVLATPPLVWLGRISYGVYLVHWPVMGWLTPARLHVGPLAAIGVQVAATLALASASFVLVERPIRLGRRVHGWRRWALPAAGATAIVLSATALPAPDRTRISALDEVRDLVVPTTVPPGTVATAAGGSAPTTTAPEPPVRVMVAGDSFAMSVVPGLQHWGEQTGRAAVLNRTIVGCGFGRGGWNRGISLERRWPAECQHRDQTITQALDEFDPEVVVVAGGMWDVTDRRLDGDRRWRTIGDPAYDAFLRTELLAFADLLGSRGAVVVWLNAPHWDPEYFRNMYMGPPPYEEAQPERTDRFNVLLAATLAERPAVRLVDLASWMRDLPDGEFGPGVRMDGVHLTAQTSDQFADWLAPDVLSAAEVARRGTAADAVDAANAAAAHPAR